jgi:3-isopropylmalate/(R)-2-methylmalate dehydratase small subunit
MTPVRTITGRAIPFGMKNVDTDLIIPGRWLKTVSRKGLAAGAFEALRAVPGNLFDDPRFSGAPILIAGENFGCGSSREHAAWALADMGLRVIIAPRFADIFAGNAFKNGLLLVQLPQAACDRLLTLPFDTQLTVDLPSQTVTLSDGEIFQFPIDDFRKHCLVNGVDEIDVTLEYALQIEMYRKRVASDRSWINS